LINAPGPDLSDCAKDPLHKLFTWSTSATE
jgi:hypothetical protein